MEAEPDLDERVSILREALERQPGEAHFEKALRLMREKRDLINGIAAKARLYEEKGRFVDVLGQWEILGIIYSSYPGLNIEVERLEAQVDALFARTMELFHRLNYLVNNTGAIDGGPLDELSVETWDKVIRASKCNVAPLPPCGPPRGSIVDGFVARDGIVARPNYGSWPHDGLHTSPDHLLCTYSVPLRYGERLVGLAT